MGLECVCVCVSGSYAQYIRRNNNGIYYIGRRLCGLFASVHLPLRADVEHSYTHTVVVFVC